MSLAEELLDSLPDNAATTHSADPETELHIVINADRTVTVPEDLKHIAVQHDHNIETVTFDCPRYWDGHDLSQMRMRIVFQRPDGHREPHLAENLRVDPDDTNVIHFDWTISNNVTPIKGAISFIACAKIADADGNIEREWHTILNQDLIVDEGMDCSGDEIVEQNPDILESILVQLDDLKSTGGVSDEQIINAVAVYLEEHPIDPGVDEQEVRDIVDEYLAENPPSSTPDSGQNVELDTTLTQSGKAADAKAVGDALANVGKPTNEQVSTAVNDYLAEHPVTSGATEEEAAAIQRFENIGFSDPLAYGNLLDTATRMLNSTGTPKDGTNVFDLAAKYNPDSPWRFMYFPVEAGGKYTVVSAKLPALNEFRAVSRDGIVLSARPTIGKNPWTVTNDAEKGVDHQTLSVPSDWPSDGYYLMLQLAYGTDNTDFDTLMVFRGEYANYQGYAPYNPELGTSSSPRLRVTSENLADDLRNKLNRGDTAVQAEDLMPTPYPWTTILPGAHYSFPVLNASAIGDFAKLCNSARICAADNNHLKLNTTYAHCPTIKIIDGIVYAVAFQNASNTDTLKGATIELFRANVAEWTVIDQTNVASAGLACGAETLTDGCIDPNMFNIDNQTLRITFTTKFSDGGHRMCYRDYDVVTGTFGDIGLCKISDGTTVHDFDIPGIRATCGDFADANPQIYMATQYATFNGEHYVAFAAGRAYKNAPILKTTDFITFTHWATPVVDGADMEYECALIACRTAWGQDFLYSATRQYKDAFNEDSRRMLVSRIALTDGSVIRSVWVPDGNIRPFWHTRGEIAYLWHTLETNRTCSTITSFPFNTNTLLPDSIGTVADTAAMIYATAEAYEADLIVCYMRKGGLFVSRVPAIAQYGYGDVVPMLEKFLDFFGTK